MFKSWKRKLDEKGNQEAQLKKMHQESQLFIKKKEEIINKVHKSSFLYLTTISKMVGMVDRIRARLQKQLKGFKESNNYQK